MKDSSFVKILVSSDMRVTECFRYRMFMYAGSAVLVGHRLTTGVIRAARERDSRTGHGTTKQQTIFFEFSISYFNLERSSACSGASGALIVRRSQPGVSLSVSLPRSTGETVSDVTQRYQ